MDSDDRADDDRIDNMRRNNSHQCKKPRENIFQDFETEFNKHRDYI